MQSNGRHDLAQQRSQEVSDPTLHDAVSELFRRAVRDR
jgi:hypothetical protein